MQNGNMRVSQKLWNEKEMQVWLGLLGKLLHNSLQYLILLLI